MRVQRINQIRKHGIGDSVEAEAEWISRSDMTGQQIVNKASAKQITAENRLAC